MVCSSTHRSITSTKLFHYSNVSCWRRFIRPVVPPDFFFAAGKDCPGWLGYGGGEVAPGGFAYMTDFFQLAHNFQPQDNPLYCGVASSVIVLNALRLNRNAVPSQKSLEVVVPENLGAGRRPYPAYSQLTLLDERTEAVKPRAVIELKNAGEGGGEIDPGLKLAQLKGILEAYDTRVDLHFTAHVLRFARLPVSARGYSTG
jgi:hypothetical protein